MRYVLYIGHVCLVYIFCKNYENRNIAQRAGKKPRPLAFQASALTITPFWLAEVTILQMPFRLQNSHLQNKGHGKTPGKLLTVTPSPPHPSHSGTWPWVSVPGDGGMNPTTAIALRCAVILFPPCITSSATKGQLLSYLAYSRKSVDLGFLLLISLPERSLYYINLIYFISYIIWYLICRRHLIK